MILSFRYLAVPIGVLVPLFLLGQICGTSLEDQAYAVKYIQDNREVWQSAYENGPDGATIYVPVKFHRIAQDNGTGEVSVHACLKQLCKLNEDYEPTGIQFYLKGGVEGGIKYATSSAVFANPSDPSSVVTLRALKSRNNDAINIFVSNSANSGSGGQGETLGFYHRINDYIVMKKDQVLAPTTSLSHEVGHFFSLAHTFYGWEGTEYDCNVPTPLYVNGVPVEYADPGKMRNGVRVCLSAADGLCDTPADYNLGFGHSGGCVYSGCAKDSDEEKLDPQEDNFMSYFTDCLATFTTSQIAVMMSNYNSSSRSYIRSSYVPDLSDIPNEQPLLILPEKDDTTQYYNEVTFEWGAVPNAEKYLLEIDQFFNFGEPSFVYVVEGTRYIATGLKSNTRYAWRVRAISEYDNCTLAATPYRFRTSRTPVGTIDQAWSKTILLEQNPTEVGVAARLQLGSLGQGDDLQLEIIDLQGRVRSTQQIKNNHIDQIITTDFHPTEKGCYFIRMRLGEKVGIKKWLVQ